MATAGSYMHAPAGSIRALAGAAAPYLNAAEDYVRELDITGPDIGIGRPLAAGPAAIDRALDLGGRAADGVIDAGHAVVDGVRDVGRPIVDSVAGARGALADGVTGGRGALATGVVGASGALANGVAGAGRELADGIAGGGFVDGVLGAGGALVGGVAGAGSALAGGVVDAGGAVVGGVAGAGGALADGVSGASGVLHDRVSGPLRTAGIGQPLRLGTLTGMSDEEALAASAPYLPGRDLVQLGLSGVETAADYLDAFEDGASGNLGDIAGLINGGIDVGYGVYEYASGDHAEGASDIVSGGGAMLSSIIGMATEGSIAPDIVGGLGDAAAGGVTFADGAVDAWNGDYMHGIPTMVDGAADVGMGLASAGAFGSDGMEAVSGVQGLVLSTLLDCASDGRDITVAERTLGEIEEEDGSTRGISSMEFAMLNGADAYHGIHDYLADGAEEGSATEIAAEVGGGLAGGLVGLGAGVVGVGGDIYNGAAARVPEGIRDAWSWMTE